MTPLTPLTHSPTGTFCLQISLQQQPEAAAQRPFRAPGRPHGPVSVGGSSGVCVVGRGGSRRSLTFLPPLLRDLRGNAFRCDCSIRWLADWLEETNSSVPAVYCSAPFEFQGRRVGELAPRDLDCISAGFLPGAWIPGPCRSSRLHPLRPLPPQTLPSTRPSPSTRSPWSRTSSTATSLWPLPSWTQASAPCTCGTTWSWSSGAFTTSPVGPPRQRLRPL